MCRLKSLGPACLAAFSLVFVGITTASAAEPLVLALPGEKVSELKYEGTGGATKPSALAGKTFTCTAIKAKTTFNALAGREADAETGSATLDLEGCKKEAVSCRSETKRGAKDPLETILSPLALVSASEETAGKVLQFAFVYKLEGPLLLNCGVVKEEMRGSFACLGTPAAAEVTAGGTVTIVCKTKAGDQETGKCVERKPTCEALAKEPFEINWGAGFEDAALEVNISGTFNKMVTLDD